MRDSRALRILVGNTLSSLEGIPPGRDLMEAFSVRPRGVGGEPFRCYRPDQTFFTGLVPEVRKFLQLRGYPVSVEDARRRPEPSGIWKIRGVEPRPYQGRVADHLGRDPLGLIPLPSAAGKSVAALAAMERVRPARAIYLSDRLDLALQFAGVAEEFLGLEPGFVGGGRCERPRAPLVVACVDSAASRAADLGPFDMTIADEAHSAASPSYFDLVLRLDSYYRLGLTATPFRSRKGEDLLLRALFGPPLEAATLDELESAGFVTRPRLRRVRVKAGPLDLTLPWQDLERRLIECPARNEAVVREALRLSGQGYNVLILVHLVRHGEVLRERLRELGRDAPLLTGDVPSKDRQSALRDFRAGRGGVLIGTEVLSVGVDVPALGALILACGQHARVPTLQRAGRVMRVSPGGAPAVKWVVDLDDSSLHPILARHLETRRRWLAGDLGLAEEEPP